MVNVLVYHHLPKSKVSLRTADDHLLFCNHSASYDNFSILTRENKKRVLELKESPLIMRDKPFLNRNITSAPVIRFLLESYLLLIVTTLFLLNQLFIIFSCVSVWAPLFAWMVLFNLLSYSSLDWTLSLSQVEIRLL